MKILNLLFFCCGLLFASTTIAQNCTANFGIYKATNDSVFYFTDSSTAAPGFNIVSRQWRFGDGTTSTTFNPNKKYTNAGTYNVCLEIISLNNATSTFCADTICKTVTYNCVGAISTIDIYGYPTFQSGQFFIAVSGGTSSLTYKWDFGTGDTASGPSVYYTFPTTSTYGVYNVCLTAKNTSGCSRTICKEFLNAPTNCIDTGISFTYSINNDTIYLTAIDSSSHPGQFPIYNRWALNSLSLTGWPGCNSKGCTSPISLGGFKGLLKVEYTRQPENVNYPCSDTLYGAISIDSNNCTIGVIYNKESVGNGQTRLGLNVIKGVPPFTYQWNNGATTSSIVVDINGIYAVTVTDNNGCSGVFSEGVTVPISSIVCGKVFNDLNGNGIKDTLEPWLGGRGSISNSVSNTIFYVDTATGAYTANVPAGVYSICFYTKSAQNKNWVATLPVDSGGLYVCYDSVIVQPMSTLCNMNFGLKDNNVQVCGYVYIDVNNNSIKDNGEPPLHGQQVRIGNKTAYTNASGYYVFNLPPGTYNLTSTTVYPYYGLPLVPTSHTVAASTVGSVYCNNNFGIQVPPNNCDVEVSILSNSNVVPGFQASYTIKVRNLGSTTSSGVLTFNFSQDLSYVSASPAPFSNTSGNITWSINHLPPFHTLSFNVRLQTPTNMQLGTPILHHAMFDGNILCIDSNLSNNWDTIHQIVRGPYDPNDKQVSPDGKIPNTAQELDYTIRFQNTGTAPAVNVFIRDTLQPNVDLSSFQLKDASHNVTLQQEGTYLNFIFSNIMLPDSNANEPESHGYVSYSIKALPNLTNGTQIKNTASIYFDFNEPIVTNTTVNTIDIPLSIQDLNNAVTIVLAPNPMRDYTNISISGAAEAPIQLEIRDMMGKVVKQQTTESNVVRINRTGISSGIYIYSITQNNKLIGTGKLIAE